MLNRSWRKRFFSAVVAGTLLGGVLAGCGGGDSGGGTGSDVLTAFTGGESITANFNQFSPNAQDIARGGIYEPLFFFNTVKTGSVQPWLGTHYAWSNGGRTVTVQLRHGVTWSDGKPFTSADVAYTFDLAIQDQALNQNALPLASASTQGPYTAIINFTQPAYTDDYPALGKTYILPQHIWQNVSDKATWLDSNPVGTGAYQVSKVSSQVMELTANPHYYLPGLPHFKKLRFLAFTGNTSADQAIESGELGWAGGFIPNIDHSYLARNSKYHVVDIPLATTFLVTNMKSGPTTLLPVRRAISAALDRDYISNTVYNGYSPPINTAALITPNYSAVLDPALANSYFGKADPQQALNILHQAGISTPLPLTIKVVAGYTDYISVLDIIKQELQPAGIDLTVDAESQPAFTADQSTGNFQLAISAQYGYTPSVYYYYKEMLDSRIAPPIGQNDAVGNYGRYDNPQVNQLLDDIASVQDPTSKKQDFYQIEHIVADQLPAIPLFEAQDEIEFNGNAVANFPTKQNTYAAPAVYIQPDVGWVAMHLTPAH